MGGYCEPSQICARATHIVRYESTGKGKENSVKLATIVIILLALASLMVYTNPSTDDLGNFVRQYVMRESQKKIEEPQGRFLGTILGGVAGGVVSSQAIRTDYVVFSTYELKLGKERFRALGIFRNFILLEKPDVERLKKAIRPPG